MTMTQTTPRLTPREVEVIEGLAANLTFAEIGERMGMSAYGAKYHATNARHKLGVSNVRQLPAAYQEATGESPWPT